MNSSKILLLAGMLFLHAGTSAEVLFTDGFSAYGVSSTDLNLHLPASDGSPHPLANVRQGGAVGSYGYLKQGPAQASQLGNAATDAGQAGAPAYADYLLLASGGRASCRLPLDESLAQGQPLTISFDMGTALPPGFTDSAWWGAFRIGALGSTHPVVGGEADFAFLYRVNKGVQVFTTGMPGVDFPEMPSPRFTLVLTDTAGTGSAFQGNGSRVRLFNGSTEIGTFDTGQLTQEFMNFTAQNALASVDNLRVETGLPAFLTRGLELIRSDFDFTAEELNLTWISQAGETYQVVRSATLEHDWEPVSDDILAAGYETSATVPFTPAEKDFFRVEAVEIFPGLGEGTQIVHDAAGKKVALSDAAGKLKIRLHYAERCLLDHVEINGKEVVSPATGVCTGIQVGGTWATTRQLAADPVVTVYGDDVIIDAIEFATGGVAVRERWRFRVLPAGVEWRITRRYLTGGTLDDSYFPGWDFASMSTWVGGLLDTGGVAWSRYLRSSASYGSHAGSVRFWNGSDALQVTVAEPAHGHLASRFSHQPSGVFTFAQSLTGEPLATKHFLRRSVGGLDVWAPFSVSPGILETTLLLEAPDGGAMRDRGEFIGLDGAAIADVLDTIGRYGVVDREIVGGNGWLTGWVCLHEPFFAQMGLALGDPHYTANLATSLDAWRDHALQPDGRVYPRWHHDTGDNMVPGTYDPATGYYEVGWGYLLDSQPDYAINVAEQFDLTGDLAWLQSQKEPCERALDWLLQRDSDGNGLVEMMTDSRTERKASDWLDVVWASYENAFVNAKLYYALTLWTEREELLGDAAKAAAYRAAAARLKESFLKPTTEGGFWDAENGWFIYWREKDGSIRGNNLVTPVNFAAVAYGLCTDRQRQILLDGMEARMRQEGLFHWPLCFLSFAPGEGRDDGFPTYENGDIFLSWGELGIRAYAGYHPATAVAYVERVLERYRQDGLSFQRYRRASQEGAGDDILAGNSMTVVGLYRNIYGVRPQWNRLMLDPHLTPELSGTRLRYRLRNQAYDLLLEDGASTASVMNFTVRAAGPFALSATGATVSWFAGTEDLAVLELVREASAPVEIEILDWPDTPGGARRWQEAAASTPPVSRTVRGLEPGASYRLRIGSEVVTTLAADSDGTVTFSQGGDPATLRTFALESSGDG